MDRIRIRETVVVEGRDDESAVLRAVDAGVLCTHGKVQIPGEAAPLVAKAGGCEHGLAV